MSFGRGLFVRLMRLATMASNFVESISLVPVIPKNKFDAVATEFLKKYCQEAIEKPMPVPILDIARKKMGLKIIPDYRLTEDFSVYGQMCFTSGKVPVYIRESDEYIDISVKRGTMLIDPDTLFERNIGCLNNTVAHECVHWYKHRNYHMYSKGAGIDYVHKNHVYKFDESNQQNWSDDDWMEWQANGIAPKILMPIQTFDTVVSNIVDSSKNKNLPLWILAEKVSDFYKVSKTSAQIRIKELGLSD